MLRENDDLSPASGPIEADKNVDAEVAALVAWIEERLLALDGPSGRARRRLIALLQGREKKNASERLAARARKFAQQGGRCDRCGQIFNRTRKVAPRIGEGQPLICAACQRAELMSAVRR